MSLLISINGAGENWATERWIERFSTRLPSMPLVAWSAAQWQAAGPPPDLDAIRYAAVWKPPQGLLAAIPNLQVIFNLAILIKVRL